MFDKQGKVRLMLAETSGVATVTLVREDGQPGMELRLAPAGDALVAVGPHDATSAAPLALHVQPAGDSEVSMLNGEKESLRLSSHREEGGIVEVHSAGAGGRLKADALSLWTPLGGPHASLSLPNGNRAQLNMSRGGGAKTELELGCASESSWLTLNTEQYGRASLMTSKDATSLALKPRGGEGGLESGTRLQDGKTVTHLYLSDIDSLRRSRSAFRAANRLCACGVKSRANRHCSVHHSLCS